MARPQRSTRDAWIDTFADWPADEQEVALDLAACVHRQTKRKTPKVEEKKAGDGTKPPVGETKPPVNGQPAATLLDGQSEAEAIR